MGERVGMSAVGRDGVGAGRRDGVGRLSVSVPVGKRKHRTEVTEVTEVLGEESE